MFKKIAYGLLALIAIAAIALTQLSQRPTPPASQAFINAQILTMDVNNTVAEALLLKGDRISAVGSTEQILKLTDDKTLVIDLAGKTLMPGFIDAHGHFPGTGMAAISANLNSPPIGKINSIAEIQQALLQQKQSKAAGEWLDGFGYDDTLLAEMRHPSRDELDEVSTDHPIYITHISGHMGVANSKALELGGIDDSTPNPEGGTIGRDENGKANGLLQETANINLQMSVKTMAPTAIFPMIKYAVNEYVQQGVTTAQSGAVDEKFFQAIYWTAKFGMVPMRLELWPLSDMLGPKILDNSFNPDDYNSDYLNVGAIKFLTDGSIQGYTGFLGQPYHSPYHDDADYRGAPIMSQKQLNQDVEAYHREGLQIALHANGDAAIDMVIKAYEKAQNAFYRVDARPIIIHAQMATEAQLDAFKTLGMTPSFFSLHTYYWGDRHSDTFLGPQRGSRISPTRSALDRDLKFTVHADSPVVPMQPLFLVWSTVNRISSSGRVIGAEQRIPTIDALRAVTIDAAWQIFQEDNRGSIEVGKFADLVVLSENPLADKQRIKDIKVLTTMVGGNIIYQQ
jgi:predicted amidohydrolase YtcJ